MQRVRTAQAARHSARDRHVTLALNRASSVPCGSRQCEACASSKRNTDTWAHITGFTVAPDGTPLLYSIIAA